MDFEKWFLRNGFGVGVKENYRKCYTKGVEVNEIWQTWSYHTMISLWATFLSKVRIQKLNQISKKMLSETTDAMTTSTN